MATRPGGRLMGFIRATTRTAAAERKAAAAGTASALRSRLRINPWAVIRVLDQPWRGIDRLASKHRADVHHRVLDSVVGWAKGKSIFFPHGFFPDGFGDASVPVLFVNAIRDWTERLARGEAAKAVNLSLGEKYADPDCAECMLQDGEFDTPFANKSMLPLECHVGRVQLVTPKMWDDVPAGSQQEPGTVAATAAKRPVVVLLAGTGEHGYNRRRLFTGHALAQQGVASVILESPFYGTRRPPGQKASKLRRVSDLPVLGRVTIEETQGLVQWLREQGTYGPVALAGVSMGGLHAAISACFMPYPVGVASYLGPTSAAPVFTKGVLANACEWKALVSQATHRQLEQCLREFEHKMNELNPGSIELYDPIDPAQVADKSRKERKAFAKRQVDRFLQLTNLTNFPPPANPAASVFVVAKHDQYVPRETMEAHWQEIANRWAGSTIKWIPGGHVSAILFPPLSFVGNIMTVLSRLDDEPTKTG